MHKVLPVIHASTMSEAQHYADIKERPEDNFALKVNQIMQLCKQGKKGVHIQSKILELRSETRLIFKYKNQGKKELKLKKSTSSPKLKKKINNRINEEAAFSADPDFANFSLPPSQCPNISTIAVKDCSSYTLVDPFGRLSPATYVIEPPFHPQMLPPNFEYQDVFGIYHEAALMGDYCFPFVECEE